MIYLGIDQSKRSTGMVLLNEKEEVVAFQLVCSDSTDDLCIMWEQEQRLVKFLNDNQSTLECWGGALIEGLSFGSVSAGKDFLAGLQWNLKMCLHKDGKFMGTVPVSMWRAQVLTKEEQREAKLQGKDGLKKATFAKLPVEVQKEFEGYVKDNKYKKTSIYDLADAYFISRYCVRCHTN